MIARRVSAGGRSRRQDLVEVVQLPDDQVAVHLVEQRLLAREVVVEAAFRHPGTADHLGHAGAVVAVLGEQLHGGVEHPLARAGRGWRGAHRAGRSSWRAMLRRCTSSGPSARCRVRTCAQASASGVSHGHAGGTEGLHRPVQHVRSGAGRGDLDRGDLGAGVPRAHGVDQPGRVEHQQPGLVDRQPGLGDPLLHHAVLRDRRTEGRAASRRARTSVPSARSATPSERMQWWMRPGPSRAWAIMNPPPRGPSRFARGTRTWS